MTPAAIPNDTATTGRQRPVPAVLPPSWLLNWRVWLVGMAILLIPFLVPIPVGLRRHPVIGSLGDQLHTVLFCGAAFMLYWKGPLTGRLLRTSVVAVVLGIAIEFLQILVGRTPLLHDVLLDMVGVGLAVSFVQWRGYGRRLGLIALIGLLVSIPVQLHKLPYLVAGQYAVQDKFPILADFESEAELALWSGRYDAEIAPVSEPDGNTFLRLTTGPSDRWPSLRMGLFPHDWTGYTHLVLRVRHRTAGVDTLRFAVRLDDFASRRENVWVSEGFSCTRQWQTFEIPVQDRRVNQGTRLLDLSDMDSIVIMVPRPQHDAVLDVDDVWLR